VRLQYSLGMMNGLAVFEPLDNDRYPAIRATRVKDLLSATRAPQR
jgi:hypothetical protein